MKFAFLYLLTCLALTLPADAATYRFAKLGGASGSLVAVDVTPTASPFVFGGSVGGGMQAFGFGDGLSLNAGVITLAPDWLSVTNTPTTLAGYGITDGLTAALAASTYEPIIGAGTLALSKLATDPLARANHTGTQAWSTITSTPTTLAGYGITDALTSTLAASTYEPIIGAGTLALSKLATDPLARANHTGTQTWSTITSTPTTLAGYGITDALTAVLAASTYQPLIADGTLALGKLATDPLARANHTGTQDASTIASGTLDMARLGVASQAEAEAGTATAKVMTPQRTAQAIAALATGALPRAYIAGFNLVYSSGTSFNVSAGVCRDSTDTYDIRLAAGLIAKRPDTAWVAGTSGGSSDGSSWTTATNYSVWAILNTTSGTVDILTSTSATSPTMPAGYTAKRRIGWVRTLAASANMTAWTQFGDLFIIQSSTAEYTGGVTTSTTPATMATPPNVLAMLTFSAIATSTWNLRIESTYNFAGSPTGSFAVAAGAANASDAGQVEIFTDASSQVYVRALTANTITVNISCRAWKDRRGRDD